MAFRDLPELERGAQLLQRSLERGRLGHAYLFTGNHLGELEAAACALAKTLNCREPVRGALGPAIDCCESCLNCRRIDHDNHPDVHWVRPESKSRIITIGQVRELMREINLKPTEAQYKVAVIVAAERLNVQSANAFLKTLEEPPANSVLILLTTDSQRILETILSRCLRLNFGGEANPRVPPDLLDWLVSFSDTSVASTKSLLGRYRLLDTLLRKLGSLRQAVEDRLSAKSPLRKFTEVEKELRDKWEDELAAAIEAEYRRERSELLVLIERWLRDVCVLTHLSKSINAPPPAALKPEAGPVGPRRPSGRGEQRDLLNFPRLTATQSLASRISAPDSLDNLRILDQLQRWLATNVQEALALEVALLKLRL